MVTDGDGVQAGIDAAEKDVEIWGDDVCHGLAVAGSDFGFGGAGHGGKRTLLPGDSVVLGYRIWVFRWMRDTEGGYGVGDFCRGKAMATLQLRQIRVPEGQTIEIEDVSWADFEVILQELGEKRNTRIAYSEGTLTIVAPMPAHEVEKVCIGRCVEVLLDELECDYTSYGSTTFKNESMLKAVEPDDCFYIRHADLMAGKQRINLSTDPPPELAIEIDLTSKTQLDAYLGLGVEELWRFDGGRLRIDCLRNGEYVEVVESPLFPGWPIKEAVERYVREAKASNQRKAKKAFRQWVIERIKE